jgi:hypothetical protein
MISAFWEFLLFLSFLLHGAWPLMIVLPLYLAGIKNPLIYLGMIALLFLAGVALFAGCPFSYLSDYLAVKAGWQNKKDYSFQKSIVYKWLIRPLKLDTKLRVF